ncbi:MAG TPA: 1,4-alpha-glucan branching protein GlgB [Candidatus Limnocylindrales bacterium]|nr:1,4-alpha-glucan branching protein GlgB [Candidatus Limnocylindrales bacterium]
MITSDVSLLSEDDLFLFNEGTHYRLYDKLGAHPVSVEGRSGTYFAVWAPNASAVSVVGPFNGWRPGATPLKPRGQSGIWEGYVPGAEHGALYKYLITTRTGQVLEKSDPYAFFGEIPPKSASIVWNLDYEWKDQRWMASRDSRNALDAPFLVYEVHIGSWMRVAEEGYRSLSYRELATRLADYVEEMGFTHVEFLPVMEHPFFGSWGYQTTGYFQPSARYGTPQDFMACVDYLHQRGIGVILDWVPSHFPTDSHALGLFDGTHLYEHDDPRQGFHPDWGSYIFNYGRHEVRSFLLSSALFWLDRYHADGLRVDGVASMLYLDYSRKAGEWVPNRYGGRENLAVIDLLRQFNTAVYQNHPDVQTIAEESTAWPMVSRPTYVGGLGFGMKWDMGWMHDTLDYMRHEPVHRKYHQDRLTFRMLYAFTENYMLPLSHDEVVYGKGSLLGKMPGDDWQKFANLRLLFSYMYAQPGKKLLFMGGEFGQRGEWNHDGSVEWEALRSEAHRGVQRWVQDLNRLLRREPALSELDFDPAGFSWIDCNDSEQSVIALLRRGRAPADTIVAAFNFTPVPRHNYRIGVPAAGFWKELLNSDAREYGGSGQGNLGGVTASPLGWHGHRHSIMATLPPLGAVFFKPAAG